MTDDDEAQCKHCGVNAKEVLWTSPIATYMGEQPEPSARTVVYVCENPECGHKGDIWPKSGPVET